MQKIIIMLPSGSCNYETCFTAFKTAPTASQFTPGWKDASKVNCLAWHICTNHNSIEFHSTEVLTFIIH